MPRAYPPLRRELPPSRASAQLKATRAEEPPVATLWLPDTWSQARFSGLQGEPGAMERGAQCEPESQTRVRA